jgi:hypothetical protein
MIVFFPHSSLPCLAPAPQPVSKLCFILLYLQQQWPSPLSQSSISCVARARSLSLSPVRKPPARARTYSEPTPNQVLVDHNSFGNSLAITGEFSPNFDLKISFRVGVILIFWRDFSFHGKKWHKFTRFCRNKIK